MGFLSSPMFGPVYGWSTGDWNSVGRAIATSGVMAATSWAGGAAWGAYSAAPGLMSGGIFITESAATSYASSYTTARIYGATNDQARGAALLAAKRGGGMAFLAVAYHGAVGMTTQEKANSTDTIGIRRGPDSTGASTGLEEGSPDLNIVRNKPIQAISGAHDWFTGTVGEGLRMPSNKFLSGLTDIPI